MKFMMKWAAVIVMLLTAQAATAGDLRWDEGHWRLELSGFTGLHQGRHDRTGEENFNATIDYETPLWKSGTLSLRLQPLFFYDQDKDNGKHVGEVGYLKDLIFDKYEDSDVYGAAIGPVFRIYQNAEERNGLFAEVGVTAMLHSAEFDGNRSNLNFISSLGVGYKFENDWHVTAIWRHISNGGIGSQNSGVNGIGIGIGYSF